MSGCRTALRRLALLSALAAAACISPRDREGAGPSAAPDPPAGVTAPAATARMEVAQPSAPSPVRQRGMDAARLVGLDAATLVALLGEPGFVRRDAPAQFWRYRNGACALVLFLYAEEGGAAAVSHVEARGAGPAAADADACLGRILAEWAGGAGED